MIYSSVENYIDSGVYNVCSPEHTSKKEYYSSFNTHLNYSESEPGK